MEVSKTLTLCHVPTNACQSEDGDPCKTHLFHLQFMGWRDILQHEEGDREPILTCNGFFLASTTRSP
jgi:hypothetical protein